MKWRRVLTALASMGASAVAAVTKPSAELPGLRFIDEDPHRDALVG
jgi:hypothetical protein